MAELAMMRASRPGANRRRPRQYLTGRVCATEECGVLISRYNKNDHCWKHAPVTYPRLRGTFSDAYLEEKSA